MSHKSGNLSLHYLHNNNAGGVCLAVSFSLTGNWFVLNKLKRGEPCSCTQLSKHSEATALAYSLYELVRDKLLSDADVQQKSKVSGVSCSLHNGNFTICVKTASSMSGIRKVLSIIEKNLTPKRLFPMYSANIKLLNGRPDRAEFSHCVNDMQKGLASLTCIIVGSVKLDKRKLEVVADAASSKAPSYADLKPTKKPASLELDANPTDYPTVKTSGMMASLVSDYIENVSNARTVVMDNSVVIHDMSWTSAKIKDKKKIVKWASSYDKVKDLSSALVYLALVNCETSADDAVLFAKKSVDGKVIAKAVEDAL